MARDSDDAHAPRMCDSALAHAFEFLGKRWNGVILGTLTNGPAGFTELRRAVAGISDSVLSDRLSELGTAGLVLRTVAEGPPVSVEYALTPAGNALLPALHELTTWASENLPTAASRATASRATASRATAPATATATSPAVSSAAETRPTGAVAAK